MKDCATEGGRNGECRSKGAWWNDQSQLSGRCRCRRCYEHQYVVFPQFLFLMMAIDGNEGYGLRSDVRLITESLKLLNRNLQPFFGENGFAARLSKLEKSVEEHHASVAELQKRSLAKW